MHYFKEGLETSICKILGACYDVTYDVRCFS
jgi:hypothetical protein